MGRIIAIANQKGGVGKTTTAINLSACLAEEGKKTLIIDIDPQGNASSGLNVDKHNLTNTTYDVLVRGIDASLAVRATEIPKLFIIPANIDLAGAEVEMVSMLSRETILKSALEEIRDDYDYLIIDCPPSLGLLTINALTVADGMLIPIQCEYFALEGLGQLINTINLIKKRTNKNLVIDGVLLTMYDGRTNLSVQVAENVKQHFPKEIFDTVITRNIKLSEAPSHGKPIILYDQKSKGAANYARLAKELLERE